MDGTVISLFLLATFLGGFTSGLTGFAAGLVVSGVWLQILTPLQTAVLIAARSVMRCNGGEFCRSSLAAPSAFRLAPIW